MVLPASPTVELFGQFISDLQGENLCLKIDFPAQLVQQRMFWPNSNLSAKFVADYASIFFPAKNNHPEPLRQRADITAALRYIANELLENAFKFSLPTAQQPVQLALYNCPERLVVAVTNTTRTDNIGLFRALINELTRLDPTALYIERLERNLDHENALESGLGFITILMNYHAQLGWKIEPCPSAPNCFWITTMAQLPYH